METTNKIEITTKMIDAVYQARKNRLIHPDGTFDKQGRWYPSDDEDSDNYTKMLRSPSKAWPYSYMVGARTLKHIKAIAKINPEYFQKVYDSIPQSK